MRRWNPAGVEHVSVSNTARGALAMARAIGEEGLSDEILSETATALKDL
jgi:hypothetical protein